MSESAEKRTWQVLQRGPNLVLTDGEDVLYDHQWADTLNQYESALAQALKRAEVAEARATRLGAALVEAAVVLEALHMAGGTGVGADIERAVMTVRAAVMESADAIKGGD